MNKKEKLENLQIELVEIVRNQLNDEEFWNFVREWLGEENIADMLEESIKSYEDTKELEDTINNLKTKL